MSYTSSDPEKLNRDPDTSSQASTSTSTQSKTKKKPWSKFKSSIKTIGKKMSTKPNFTEPTESSEQRRVKKNRNKAKDVNSGEGRASASDETQREKSPTKGPKSLIKKLSVEGLSTPFVGYQPSSVSPTKPYAKALHKSGSTSESTLSATSDLDSPRKSLTLDKNTKYNQGQGSPDSGRESQSTGSLGGSGPPSQVTEEGYGSGLQRGASDLSVDSDSGVPRRPAAKEEVAIDSLVSKTRQFAQSLKYPLPTEKENDANVTVKFLKAETLEKAQKAADELKNNTKQEGAKENQNTKVQDKKTEGSSKPLETVDKSKDSLTTSKDEVDGRKKDKSGNKSGAKPVTNLNADFIKSEQGKAAKDGALKSETQPQKNENKSDLDLKTGKGEEKLKTSKSEEKAESNSKTNEGQDKSESDVKQKLSGQKSLPNEKFDSGDGNTTPKPIALVLNPVKQGAKSSEAESKESEKKSDRKEDAKPTTPEVSKNDEPKDSSSATSQKSKTPPEKASSSKTPELNPPLPLSPSATTSPKSQSEVEEKLEAFLSAEGWSGTIKDVAARSSAEGSQQLDKRECLYKILVIGELGTGKTSIIKRYVHQFFSQHYRATIGVDFALKVLNWDPNTIIRLQLWDIAGQERFGNMTRVYYKEAVGAFIVFDVTRSATFDAVLKWKQDLDSKVQLADGSPIPCVLLANKCDQQKEGIVNAPAKMEEYCEQNNFSAWFETSAKENINIDEAAKSLVTQILQNDKMSQNGRDSARDGSKFPLDGKSEQEGSSCAC